jgi:hypothetical protein
LVALTLGLFAVGSLSASRAAYGRDRAAAAGVSCGYWRWPVKTGSDADRNNVNPHVVTSSIWNLIHLAAPSSFPQDARIAPVEDTIYQLNNVTLSQYKLEDDGDIHLIVKDAAGRTMITELPDPRCVSSTSPWKARITTVRRNFLAKFPLASYWHYPNRRVDVQGLGFFDQEHGQDGVAPNDIELHPVIFLWAVPPPPPQPPPPPPPPPPPTTHSAWCSVSPSYNPSYNDYDVYVDSNQPDQQVTVSDSAGDSHSWYTDANGYADVFLRVSGSAAGQTVTAYVGAATCSTTL